MTEKKVLKKPETKMFQTFDIFPKKIKLRW